MCTFQIIQKQYVIISVSYFPLLSNNCISVCSKYNKYKQWISSLTGLWSWNHNLNFYTEKFCLVENAEHGPFRGL